MDAQRRLTRAHADGDLAAVAAAAGAVEDARRAAEVLTTQLAAEQRQLAEDRMRTIEEVVAQAGWVFDAGLAATDALSGFPGPTGETTRHRRAEPAQ